MRRAKKICSIVMASAFMFSATSCTSTVPGKEPQKQGTGKPQKEISQLPAKDTPQKSRSSSVLEMSKAEATTVAAVKTGTQTSASSPQSRSKSMAASSKKSIVAKASRGNKAIKNSSGKPSQVPQVIGSAAFKGKVGQALELLKAKAPDSYQNVCKYLYKIVENANSGVDIYSKTFFLGSGTIQQGDVYWVAGVIVHDAYHSQLYSNGQAFVGAGAEETCNQVQKKALRDIGAPDYYLTYLDEVSKSQYWEVPFNQRSW